MLAKPVIQNLDKEKFQLRLFSRTVKKSMFEKDYDILQGDVFNTNDLDRAMNGCDAVHISLSNVDEGKATEVIIKVAKIKICTQLNSTIIRTIVPTAKRMQIFRIIS